MQSCWRIRWNVPRIGTSLDSDIATTTLLCGYLDRVVSVSLAGRRDRIGRLFVQISLCA
ncbi:hypothetical protein ASPBRDRAFT_49460, partial [Aspergillus brasiliensis CBS 101740]